MKGLNEPVGSLRPAGQGEIVNLAEERTPGCRSPDRTSMNSSPHRLSIHLARRTSDDTLSELPAAPGIQKM